MRSVTTILMAHLLLGLFIETAPAMGPSHQHDASGQGSAPASCSKPENAPSLTCAKVPTPYIAKDGSLWLAWTEHGHVYVGQQQKLNSKGFDKIVRITNQARDLDANGESRPKIAVGPKGEIYVTFTAKGEKKYTGIVYFSRSVDGGQTFTKPKGISDEKQTSSLRFAALGVNKAGRIHIAWLDKRDLFAAKKAKQPYTGSAMYYAFSDDQGETFSANTKGLAHSCECCRIAMDYDTDDNPVILWRHIFGKNFRDHAMAKVGTDGLIQKTIRISEDNWAIDGCPHHGPDLSISETGIKHVVWFSDADKRSGLFYANQTKSAEPFSPPMGFGNPDNQAAHPQVHSIGKDVYIAWKEFNGEQSEVYLMQSGNNGQSWSVPHRVAATNGASDHPFLIQDKNWLYLSWATISQGWQLFPLTPLARR